MIYMRGLKAKDLVAIVDFIYHGEASIYQEDLDGFLALAEELQLNGLAGSDVQNLDITEEIMKQPNRKQPQRKFYPKPEHNYVQNTIEDVESFTTSSVVNQYIGPVDYGKIIVASDTSKEDLKVKQNAMMERAEGGENKWKCTVCGKTTRDTTDMRRHIERHVEGLTYPCTQCNKVSRSSRALLKHGTSHHNEHNGEASIYQEDLDGFLALDLQLKGLAGSDVQNVAVDPMKQTNKKQPKGKLDPKLEPNLEPNTIEDIDTTSSAAETNKEDLKI